MLPLRAAICCLALVLTSGLLACEDSLALGEDVGPRPDLGFRDAGSSPDAVVSPDLGAGLDASVAPDAEPSDSGTNAFVAYDEVVRGLLADWSIPGATVALTRDERLVHLQAYGFADAAETRVMMPSMRFRIASVSKPITAAAVMLLVQQGRLTLDEPAFAHLAALEPAEGATPDSRLGQITIRHLLEHSGGWDRDQSGDPMFQSFAIASAMGVPPPAEASTIVAYMKGRPLDFDPGSRFAYSNFGYAVLGRIIEVVTSTSYDHFVKTSVLAPMGIQRMEIGRTRPELRPEDEVDYESFDFVPSVFPDVAGVVPVTDGGWYNEALDSHGGWIASAADLARFMTGLDGWAVRPDLLDATSIAAMIARPAVPDWAGQAAWYGLGWIVRPDGGNANWWHGGSLPGTTTLIVRTGHGFTWSALLNSRPSDPAQIGQLDAALDEAMWQALATVTEWPEHDLFDRVP